MLQSIRTFRIIYCIPALLFIVLPSAIEAQRRFTPEDALNVRLPTIQDMSKDGRRVAVTVQTQGDRLNVNHGRYGDPTYVSPSKSEILIIDTESGTQYQLFEGDSAPVRNLRWSPDGSKLAFLRYTNSTFKLMIHNVPTGQTEEIKLDSQLTLASNSPLEWSPDGKNIAIGLRSPGWEIVALQAYLDLSEGPIVVQDSDNDFLAWDAVRKSTDQIILSLVNLADGSVQQVLPEQPVVSPKFSQDGQSLVYTTATRLRTSYLRSQGTEYEIFELDLSSLENQSVHSLGETRINPIWNHPIDAFAYSSDGDIFLRSLIADTLINLTPPTTSNSEEYEFEIIRWNALNTDLLLSSQAGYHILDIQSGDIDLIYGFEDEEDERPDLGIESWTDDNKYLYISYSAPDRWERGLLRYNVETQSSEDLILDQNLYRNWNISEDASTIVYSQTNGDVPPEVWVSDNSFDKPRQLTELNPWIKDIKLTKSELISYLNVDGKKLYGILYYPIDYDPQKTYPLVAEIYETFFDNGFNANMNLLANQGWFGFRPSVDLEIGFPGEAWVKGVTTAINTVIDGGLVDEHKLGVHGTSYGGYATNLLITQTNRFAAAINISGKVNIISFLGDSEKITTRNYQAAEEGQDRIGATLWEQPQKYIAHSAIMFADRIDTPLLMLSGEDDWNVPETNQREMYYALRRLGKKVTWVNYMRAGHGAGRAGTKEDFLDHWNRIFEWYATYFSEEEK